MQSPGPLLLLSNGGKAVLRQRSNTQWAADKPRLTGSIFAGPEKRRVEAAVGQGVRRSARQSGGL